MLLMSDPGAEMFLLTDFKLLMSINNHKVLSACCDICLAAPGVNGLEECQKGQSFLQSLILAQQKK